MSIHDIRNGLNALTQAIDALQSAPVPQPEILDRSLSGNKINGGKITNFASAGIVDEANQQILTVHNDGITVRAIQVQSIDNDLSIAGNLTVQGEVHASRLHVDEISADVRNERTTPLEFRAENGNLSGKGLIWTGAADYTKQFVFRDNPNKFWSSEDIDLGRDKVYRVDNIPVLSLDTLGDSVRNSNLSSVGTLEGLSVDGPLTVDAFIFYDPDNQRLGIGTEAPNAMVSLKNIDHEFIIDNTEDRKFKVGTWTTSALQIVTDNTTRLEVASNGNVSIGKKLSIAGNLGIGVQNFADDVDITTSKGIRIQDKKFEVADNIPQSGNYVLGDIVWNSNPVPTGTVGWICIRSGTPGEWKPFGQIHA